MGTSWKKLEVSEAFNQYNDMLENVLGYEVILRMIKQDKNVRRILDYGCGPGKVSRRLIDMDENLEIIAVDQSQNMLDIAQKYRSHKNIRYRLVENNSLSFVESNSIDCIITCFVFINNSDYQKIAAIIKEFERVLKKGGKFIILDSNPDAAGESFSTFTNGVHGKKYMEGEEKTQTLKISGQEDLVLHDWYWTKENYLKWLEEANLRLSNMYEYTIKSLPQDIADECMRKYADYTWGGELEKAPFIIIEAIK